MAGIGLGLFDLAFLAHATTFVDPGIQDSFETYAEVEDIGSTVLNDGSGWAAAWVTSTPWLGAQAGDSFESYADLAAVHGLNLGTGWSAAWVDVEPYFGPRAQDSMESYTDGGTPGNDGSGWSSGWTE